MPPQPPRQPIPGEDTLLRPREVAAIFGVRPATIARWAREGRLSPLLTPGGHRRYRPADIREVLDAAEPAGEPTEEQRMAEDAARLYEQGWTIRQVAVRFGRSYGVMRRILQSRTTLRDRGGARHPLVVSDPRSARHDPADPGVRTGGSATPSW